MSNKGYLNLNRFKSGKSIKQQSKQRKDTELPKRRLTK